MLLSYRACAQAMMYSMDVQVQMKEVRWLCSFCQQQNAIDVGVQDLRV